ncbi:MAG: hypothetical protein NVSMB48_13090 [Marmoricola sp.]
MALSFDEWAKDDEPGVVIDVTNGTGWDEIRDRYTVGVDEPLERIIAIAHQHGVKSVIVEHRYIDADWRSEHANFYGSTFRRYPSVTHRLHFFAASIAPDFSNLEEHAESYRGYSVMRPLSATPVGRTMIKPPPELDAATLVEGTERINLFGFDLNITAMPFISQDAQYLRCAHASIWMVLRHAYLNHGLPKRTPGDVREAATGGLLVGRQLPSDGLSTSQMLNALDRLGLPTGMLEPVPDPGPGMKPPPGSTTLYGTVCRYVNSDLPPIVISDCHAWVVVGWDRTPSGGHDALTIWRHDDARGPYIRVDNPWAEPDPAHNPWRWVLTPLMPRMNLDAERAEATGAAILTLAVKAWANGGRASVAAASGDLTFRTYAVTSSAYKRRLRARSLDPELVQLYRTTQMPKYVWVVEVVDRIARKKGLPNVMGEVVLDSTHGVPDNLASAGWLCMHVEGTALSRGLDHGTIRKASVSNTSGYLSDRDARS